MGLFEWLGESYHPGPVGRVGLSTPQAAQVTRGEALVRAVFALLVLVGVLVFLRELFPSRRAGFIIVGGMAVYLVLSHVLDPQPESSNMGYFGGLVDHPLRYSDDLNRLLLFFAVLVAPGRFITGGLRDGWRALTGRWITPKHLRGWIGLLLVADGLHAHDGLAAVLGTLLER